MRSGGSSNKPPVGIERDSEAQGLDGEAGPGGKDSKRLNQVVLSSYTPHVTNILVLGNIRAATQNCFSVQTQNFNPYGGMCDT